MNREVRWPRSWRASEARAIRPGPWLIAAAVVGMLLVEVWQCSRVAQLSLALDQIHKLALQAQARLEFVQAQVDRQTTRTELAPLASRLELVPVDAQQVVQLPSEFLADARDGRTAEEPQSVLAWAERASRALVPEATARSRAHRN